MITQRGEILFFQQLRSIGDVPDRERFSRGPGIEPTIEDEMAHCAVRCVNPSCGIYDLRLRASTRTGKRAHLLPFYHIKNAHAWNQEHVIIPQAPHGKCLGVDPTYRTIPVVI